MGAFDGELEGGACAGAEDSKWLTGSCKTWITPGLSSATMGECPAVTPYSPALPGMMTWQHKTRRKAVYHDVLEWFRQHRNLAGHNA